MKLGSPGHPVNSFVFLKPANINGARLYGTLTSTVFNGRGVVVELSVSRCVRGRAISHLINSPPNCINFSRNKRLARGIEGYPCSMVLFSRVRGTRPSMFGVLLRVLRSNVLASSRNEHISFGGAMVVVASGINTHLVASGGMDFKFSRGSGSKGRSVGTSILGRLGGAFHPRFLGHISSVIIFAGLGGSRVRRVTRGVLSGLGRQAGTLKVRVSFSSDIGATLTRGNFSTICNTHPLHHRVRGGVRSTLDRGVLRNDIGGNSEVRYDFVGSKFVFRMGWETFWGQKGTGFLTFFFFVGGVGGVGGMLSFYMG